LVDDEYGNYFAGDVFKAAEDGFYRVDGVLDNVKLDGGWRVEVGLKNFETIFTDVQLREPLVKVISWTFMFAIATVLTTFILGLFIALTFNHDKLRGKKFYRLVMILPYAFPGFLSAYVWVGLLNRENGFINTVIFGQTPGSEANFPWLLEEGPARMAVLLVNLWLGFPYMFLITTGALQSIPSELNEAAEIDGAKGLTLLRTITLPLIKRTISLVLILSVAGSLLAFDQFYIITGGNPNGSTLTTVFNIYRQSFLQFQLGYGAALSVLVAIALMLISLIQLRVLRGDDHE
jgi:arabinogalactan oligomer/maltooligosaccharide transport system permease protein